MTRTSRTVAKAITLLLLAVTLQYVAAAPLPQATPTPTTTTPTPTMSHTTTSSSAEPSETPWSFKNLSTKGKVGYVFEMLAWTIPVALVGGYFACFFLFGFSCAVYFSLKWIWEHTMPFGKATLSTVNKWLGSAVEACKNGIVAAGSGAKSCVVCTAGSIKRWPSATRAWAAGKATAMADAMRRPHKTPDIEMTANETEAAIDKKLAKVMAEVEEQRSCKRKSEPDPETSTIAPSYRSKDDAPAYPPSCSESDTSSERGLDFSFGERSDGWLALSTEAGSDR